MEILLCATTDGINLFW